MRDFRGMKRQRGRNRKPGGGGGGGHNNPNRAFESNGPEGGKIRGNAQHVYERYHQLARDAFAAGDRVLAENYLQHAEHYFRVLRTLQPQRPVSEIAARDAFASGFDIDFEDESGAQAETLDEDVAEAPEAEAEAVAGREDRDSRREREPRRDADYRRDEPRREERRDDRRDRDREFGESRAESDGQRRESRRERFERRDRRPREDDRQAEAPVDPLAVVEPRASGRVEPEDAPPPRRSRSEPDAGSQLPAFLRAAPTAAVSGGAGTIEDEPERPRRAPRRRRVAESDGVAGEATGEEV